MTQVQQREKPTKRTPSTIGFDRSVLMLPSLEETGVDRLFSKLGIYKSLVEPGEWVDRRQPVMSIVFHAFSRPLRSRWPFARDEIVERTFEIPSPVAGLMLAARPAYCAYYGSSYATSSGRSLCYGEREVLPMLLLPRDEPPQEYWATTAYDEIRRWLADAWPRLLFSHAELGYVRLRDAEYSEQELVGPRNSLFQESGRNDRCEVSNFDPDNRSMMDTIQRLRSGDLELRDKLVHLTRG